MKPGPFKYHDPKSVDDLLALLASLEDAKLLAGGQSLMPMMNLRFVQPDHVIDLNGIEALSGIRDDDGALKVGAMTRQVALQEDPAVAARTPIIKDALKYVGHFQTRNRGTLGGSLCHLDPAAELPMLMLLYDATLKLRGESGARDVSAREWSLAYMTPNIALDEVLVEIEVPYWSRPHAYAFEEFARRHGDFAIVAVACLLAIDEGVIRQAAISIGGMRDAPFRLDEAESALIGQPASAETFKSVAAVARAQDAATDSYITAQYRQRLAGVLVERALIKAVSSQ